MRRVRVRRLSENDSEQVEDLVTEEIALSVLAEHRRLAVLMCSPADLEDLVRGFFYTSRLVERPEDLRSIVVNRATCTAFVGLAPELDVDLLPARGVVTSGCGSAGAPEDEGLLTARGGGTAAATGTAVAPGLRPPLISDLMGDFARLSEVHRQTGGVHAAALADRGGIRLFREDIGRHNAVDKVVGAWLGGEERRRDPEGLSRMLLLSSGRLSSEIVSKAVRCGLPVVVSRGAPTDRAVSLARAAGLTLIGFARGRRMNVYSGLERVEHPSRRAKPGSAAAGTADPV